MYLTSAQQPSTSKIDIKTEAGILPAYNRNLKISLITLPDTLPKQSNVPLLRNE